MSEQDDVEKEVALRIENAVSKKRKRTQRQFPACSFEDAIAFAYDILKFGGGQPVRRLSLLDYLGKSPESSTSRQLITNANRYGLVEGGYSAEQLKLTSAGILATNEETSKIERIKARINLAIENIGFFRSLYERFKNNRLPARTALVDAAKEQGVDSDSAKEAIDIFILNLRFVGLLQMLSGAERIVTINHVLEALPSSDLQAESELTESDRLQKIRSLNNTSLMTNEQAQFEIICFYITPIGESGSEQRKHSDLFLSSLVEPALEQLHLRVVRADNIDKPGTITKQIIEYIIKSRLVIADLSFHNPNVFYELAIRHAVRLPVVQLIRTADRIPFDLSHIRTIQIDTTDIYSLVPRLEIYRSEISNQVRRCLEDPDAVDNPVSTLYPTFKSTY